MTTEEQDRIKNEILNNIPSFQDDTLGMCFEKFEVMGAMDNYSEKQNEELLIENKTLGDRLWKMSNNAEDWMNKYKKVLSDDKTLLQEFYSIGKVEQLRDKIIIGTYAIGSNGFKEPTDWKAYAERLEEYIINTMIKERKI